MSNKDKGISDWDPSLSRTLNVGYGNLIRVQRIVSILEANSLPMRRLRDKAAVENLLVDATAGRKTRAIVLTDSRHVVLSALSTTTLQERLHGSKPMPSPAEVEMFSGEFFS